MKQYTRLFTFGCSFTAYNWPTWANIIAYDLAIPFHQMGQTGIGNVSIAAKMLECDIKHKFTSTDLILVNWSTWSRVDMVCGNRRWLGGGNMFNHNEYDDDYIEKYWTQEDDIVKNATAIISSNRMFDIAYQSHMLSYTADVEYQVQAIYDFTGFEYLLGQLPKQHIFDISNNTQFNNTVADSHPDIATHLVHVNAIYNTLGLAIKDTTTEKYNAQQLEIENTIPHHLPPDELYDWCHAYFKNQVLL